MSRRSRPPQLTPHNAAAFQLDDVVASYHLRSPYPSALAAFLEQLTAPRGGPVLDLGCGTGEIARSIAQSVERVDAVDISAPMLDRGRTMPGGDEPRIRWMLSAAERFEFDGPYALVVSGDALHWMDWDVVLPRVAASLSPGAFLAIVHAVIPQLPWSAEVAALFATYSVIERSEPQDLIGELESRRLFRCLGRAKVGPTTFYRTTQEYIDSLHATAALPRHRMGADRASQFDAAVSDLLSSYSTAPLIEMQAVAEVAWGLPAPVDGE